MSILERLYQVNLFSEKNGLENMRILCKRAGDPQNKFKTVHIAGTNGKGSVSTKIAAGFQLSGKKVGLFTSPHLKKFNERIKIDYCDISDELRDDYIQKAFDIAKGIPATYFELVTLTAFLYFADQKIDIAVLEAGLGGRLDATNVIHPLVSVITSISLEHTEILGDTVEAIAIEKAGIIKPNVPVVIGPTVPLNVIKEKTDLIFALSEIYNTFQEENNAVAEKAMLLLGIQPAIIKQALLANPPRRLEIHYGQVPIIFDGGHNEGGIKQLVIALERKYGWKRFHTLCSFGAAKNMRPCFELLKPVCETITLLPPAHPRLASIEMMSSLLPKGMTSTQVPFVNIQEMAKASQLPILVTGSFYIDFDSYLPKEKP